MKASLERGFTLIELVVVITILGILAAFAVPRFIALDSQARIATVNGLAGSVKSAAVARARPGDGDQRRRRRHGDAWKARPITLNNYYPDSTDDRHRAVNSNNTQRLHVHGRHARRRSSTWTKKGAPTPAQLRGHLHCRPTASAPPTIAVVTSGC